MVFLSSCYVLPRLCHREAARASVKQTSESLALELLAARFVVLYRHLTPRSGVSFEPETDVSVLTQLKGFYHSFLVP